MLHSVFFVFALVGSPELSSGFTVYLNEGKGSSAGLYTVAFQEDKLVVQEVKSSFRLSSEVDYATISAGRRFVAESKGGRHLRIVDLVDDREVFEGETGDETFGKRSIEGLHWAGAGRLSVFFDDLEGGSEPVLGVYEIGENSVSASHHPVRSEHGAWVREYQGWAEHYYDILDKHDVGLLGHRRAWPFTPGELFGATSGSWTASVSRDRSYAVMHDLFQTKVYVLKDKAIAWSFDRQGSRGYRQVRAVKDMILICTDDGKVEVWDVNKRTYVGTVLGDLIVD